MSLLNKLFDLENLPNVAGRFIYDELSPRDLIMMTGAHPIISNFACQTRRRPTDFSVSIQPSPGSAVFSYTRIVMEFSDKEPLYWYLNQEIQRRGNRTQLRIGDEEYVTTEDIDQNQCKCLVSFVPNSNGVKKILAFLTDFFNFPIKTLRFMHETSCKWPNIDKYDVVDKVENLYLEVPPDENTEVFMRRVEKGLSTGYGYCEWPDAEMVTPAHLPFIKCMMYRLTRHKLTVDEMLHEFKRRQAEIETFKFLEFGLYHLPQEAIQDMKRRLNLGTPLNRRAQMFHLLHVMAPCPYFNTAEVSRGFIPKDAIINEDSKFYTFHFSGETEDTPHRVAMIRFEPRHSAPY